jgi:hypothetical protein
MIVALVVGVGIGFGIATAMKGKQAAPSVDATPSEGADWWEMRKTLTGTQLQILQYMEARREASITALQEKFSFIPDRELYYRLEQIVLMKFLIRGRKDGDVIYTLNTDYSGTVEDDKTVMLSSE